MSRDVIPTGRAAVSLLDVVQGKQRQTPVYKYLRQNARALAAAAVAPGAEKPVSTVGVTTVDGSASVIATLSEPVDRFILDDAPQLAQFVQTELTYAIDLAISNQLLAGTGTGANQTGILNTSGVQTGAFDTSALVSIRKSLTKAEQLGYAPSVLAIRGDDWEAIELAATSDDAVAFRGIPIDLAERRIWGLRVVVVDQLPAKTALVFDPAAVAISTVGGLEIDVAREGGDLFSHNQVQFRVECRVGIDIYQPAAITKVATAA